MEEKPKKRSQWKKKVLGVLFLLLVALAVLLLNINTIARIQINKALNRYLTAGGNLESIDIHLIEGRVALSGLVLHPPPGFEPHPLLSLDDLEVDVEPWALLSGKVVVEDLALYGLSLNIVRDEKGRLSPLELMASQTAGTEIQSESPQQDEASPWIPVVHAHAIQLEKVSFRLLDRKLNNDWSASLRVGLKVEELQLLDLLNLDILVERFGIKISDILVDQPPGFSRKPLLSVNRIEVASQDIAFNTYSFPVSDIILDTLAVSVERNPDREMNILKLAESWLPDMNKSDNEMPATSSVTSTDSSGPLFEIPSVVVDNIQLNSISAQLLDSVGGQPWRAGFDGMDLGITGVEVGDLSEMAISLASFGMDLRGVTVDQPPGFSEAPLLAMDTLRLASREIDLSESKVSISDVTLDTLKASLEQNADREINLMKLAESWLPAKDESDNVTPAASSATPTEFSGPIFEMPLVLVDSIQLNSISVQLLAAIDSQPWRAGFDGLDMTVKGVELGDLAKQAIALSSLDLDVKGLTVDQPPGYSETPLLSMDSFEMASKGVDLGASNISISNVILDTLAVSVERNPDREVNLLKLAESWLPASDAGKDEQAEPSESPTSSSGVGFAIPTVIVDNIELKNISARLLDSIDDQPWRAGFDDLDVLITGVNVGATAEQHVSLASFDLDLKGVRVDQPPGFDDRKLFGLEQFTVISDKRVGPGEELVVKEVELQGLTASVTMRADGVTNLQVLKKSLLEKDVNDWPPKEKKGAEKRASSAKIDLQPVLFEKISLDGGPVTYRDDVFAKEPLAAYLNDIQMEIKELRLFNDEKDVNPASASLSFEFEQPGELPTAYFGTIADVGPIGKSVPMANTQVRLVGLKLDTLGSLVPPATRSALGASGLDVGAALAIDADSINLNASVLTDRHIRYEGITVQGPLDKPVVKIGPVMAGVFGRVSDGLINLGKDGLKSGVDIAEGGALAAKELGVGAVKVGANLGKSLFETTAGMVTFDKEKVKEGAQGSTKGTFELTKGSVTGTGEAAGSGLKNSASEMKGEGRVKAWEQDIPVRYEASMKHARTVLSEMPYPPVTE